MTVRPLVYEPDPRLRTKPKMVDFGRVDTATLERHFVDLMDTMEAHSGVGLAANQIGLDLSLAVVIKTDSLKTRTGKKPQKVEVYRCVNLETIVAYGGDQFIGEGCLSCPQHFADSHRRARSALVQAQDLMGNPLTMRVTGFQAQVFQHEADHLHGRLFIDGDRRDFSQDEPVGVTV